MWVQPCQPVGTPLRPASDVLRPANKKKDWARGVVEGWGLKGWGLKGQGCGACESAQVRQSARQQRKEIESERVVEWAIIRWSACLATVLPTCTCAPPNMWVRPCQPVGAPLPT
eukprot:85834-Chlamydomonas_euryale.AAC.1